MTANKNLIKWLIFLLLIVAIVVSLSANRGPGPQLAQKESSPRILSQSEPRPTTAKDTAPEAVDSTDEEYNYHQKLDHAPRVYLRSKRNIFNYADGGASPYGDAFDAPPELPKPDPRAAAPEFKLSQKAARPVIRYLGFFREKENQEKKLAAISNSGQIYLGGVGDVLGDKYEVLQVEDEYLVLRWVSDKSVVRYPLGRGVPEDVDPAAGLD